MILQKNTNGKVGNVNYMGTMVITPEIANEMLKHNFVNRKINKERVHVYAHDMKNGNWGGVIDGLSLQFDKEENLLNGQHRLRAIIESGVSLEMFIFQTDFTSNSLELPFDIGALRPLALLMKTTTNYAGTVNGFIGMGTSYNKCTPAMFTSFENSFSKDEIDFFQYIAKCNVVGFSVGVKIGFLLYCFEHKDKWLELKELWKCATGMDCDNKQAVEMYKTIMKNKPIGGGENVRKKLAIQTYGYMNGGSFSRSQKYSEEFYKKIHEFMKGRI